LYQEENKLALFLGVYTMASLAPAFSSTQSLRVTSLSSSDIYALKSALIRAYNAGTLRLTEIAVRNPKLYEIIMQLLAESTPAAAGASSSVGVQLGAKVASMTLQELFDYIETLLNDKNKQKPDNKPKPKPKPEPQPQPEPEPEADPEPDTTEIKQN
jgi:outer membrane biosynthesis protein TonB